VIILGLGATLAGNLMASRRRRLGAFGVVFVMMESRSPR
jgi:hypothetical protein